MSKSQKSHPPIDATPISSTNKSSPASLVFISHDSRDATLAEAFSKLLASVSCGVLKSFRSSDHKTTQGIEYGVEWYPAIQNKLDEAGDVVALLTPRSAERPWILFECGIAKGKLDARAGRDTKIKGLAVGLPLNKISGPFAQFQNCPFEIPAITKLVMELVSRIPGADPDRDAVQMQATQFHEKAKQLVEAVEVVEDTKAAAPDGASAAKQFEEIKVMFQELPSRMESLLDNTVGARRSPSRRKMRLHPMMIDEMMMIGEGRGNPGIAWLVLISQFRDELPWLYELGMKVYRAMESGPDANIERAISEFQDAIRLIHQSPISEELLGEDISRWLHPAELDLVVHHFMRRWTKRRPGRKGE